MFRQKYKVRSLDRVGPVQNGPYDRARGKDCEGGERTDKQASRHSASLPAPATRLRGPTRRRVAAFNMAGSANDSPRLKMHFVRAGQASQGRWPAERPFVDENYSPTGCNLGWNP